MTISNTSLVTTLLPHPCRITTSEAGLVSVNDFIEHSPLFAKRLIDSMDVIREGTLRAECGRCLAEAGPRLRAWCRRR